jgi:hypothetical protein
VSDPAVLLQAVQAAVRSGVADAGQLAESADVDVEHGCDGLQREAAEHVQDAAVGRAACSCPAAGAGPGTGLRRVHDVEDLLYAGLERRVGPVVDACAAGQDVGDGAFPLVRKSAVLLESAAGDAAGALSRGADVLQSGGALGVREQRPHVGQAPARPHSTEQDGEENRGGVLLGQDGTGQRLLCGRRQGPAQARQVAVAAPVTREPACRIPVECRSQLAFLAHGHIRAGRGAEQGEQRGGEPEPGARRGSPGRGLGAVTAEPAVLSRARARRRRRG